MLSGDALEEAVGKGDTQGVVMLLQAQQAVIDNTNDILLVEDSLLPQEEPKSEEDKEKMINEQKGEVSKPVVLCRGQ